MSEPLAYLITFRTYGTWLPGDDRGWVHRDRNAYGALLEDPRRGLHYAESHAMRAAPLELTLPMRAAVDAASRTTCAYRDWLVGALNVRTNHVHVVVSSQDKPEWVMNTLKIWATGRLRDDRLLPPNRPVWARHGSTSPIWNDDSLARACGYVTDGQDAKPGIG